MNYCDKIRSIMTLWRQCKEQGDATMRIECVDYRMVQKGALVDFYLDAHVVRNLKVGWEALEAFFGPYDAERYLWGDAVAYGIKWFSNTTRQTFTTGDGRRVSCSMLDDTHVRVNVANRGKEQFDLTYDGWLDWLMSDGVYPDKVRPDAT